MDTEQKSSGVFVASPEKDAFAIDDMTTYVVGLEPIRKA
jgi:uncharacterized protein (DUF362 family)